MKSFILLLMAGGFLLILLLNRYRITSMSFWGFDVYF